MRRTLSAEAVHQIVIEQLAQHNDIPFDLAEKWGRLYADSPDSESMGMIEWAVRQAVDKASYD